jgi:hypothetical protein
VNPAVAVLPLESVAAQRTIVLPNGTSLPDLGSHETGTAPPTPSVDVTFEGHTSTLRTSLRSYGLRAAPCSFGAVASNARPGTSSVPVQVSVPGALGTIECCAPSFVVCSDY